MKYKNEQGQYVGMNGVSEGDPTETIIDTVEDWLDEHISGGSSVVVVDDTLSTEGAAADAKAAGDRLTALESAGVSAALKAALLQLAEKVAYIDNGGPNYYQDLYDALYSSGGGGGTPEPVVTLESIAAVLDLEGHAVMVGDSLDTLKDYLTVTAYYSDESERTITNYSLSGTIAEGTNTITVTYLGETDTFTVTGVAPSVLPTGYTEIPSLYCSGLRDVYLSTGVYTGDIDYAEYNIMPTDLKYLKAGHVICATGHYFPYLTGDNTNGERSRIGFNNRGKVDADVTSGSYVFPWSFNERHTLMGFVDGKVYVDAVEKFTVPAGSASSSQIVIFGAPDADRFFVGRLYWLKFYKNGEVYRNYIPAKNSSNIAGLYETVTGTFLSDPDHTNIIKEGGE